MDYLPAQLTNPLVFSSFFSKPSILKALVESIFDMDSTVISNVKVGKINPSDGAFLFSITIRDQIVKSEVQIINEKSFCGKSFQYWVNMFGSSLLEENEVKDSALRYWYDIFSMNSLFSRRCRINYLRDFTNPNYFKESIAIIFVDFSVFDFSSGYCRFSLNSTPTTNGLSLHIFELPKIVENSNIWAKLVSSTRYSDLVELEKYGDSKFLFAIDCLRHMNSSDIFLKEIEGHKSVLGEEFLRLQLILNSRDLSKISQIKEILLEFGVSSKIVNRLINEKLGL